jgi:hypothetical protein
MNGFEDAMLLFRLIDDPETYKARLQELQAAEDAAAKREVEAATAYVVREADLATET